MTAEPWTPGPWWWNDSASLDRLMSAAKGHHDVILVHDRAAYAGAVDEADARLIAAAPEMAALLDRYALLGPVAMATNPHALAALDSETLALLAHIRGEAR